MYPICILWQEQPSVNIQGVSQKFLDWCNIDVWDLPQLQLGIVPLEFTHWVQCLSQCWKHLWKSCFMMLSSIACDSAWSSMISSNLFPINYRQLSFPVITSERKFLSFLAWSWRSLHTEVSFASGYYLVDGAQILQ
jgi:hypothetical protein